MRSEGAAASGGPSVEIFWLPVGAGGHSVRWNGRVFEALLAARERRPRCALYHCALALRTPAGRWTLELAPVTGAPAGDRGVVLSGPVGVRVAGRSPWFRYELRCWLGGTIPDAELAVGGPRPLSDSPQAAQRILDLAPKVPALVWGRDESRVGEMWNSNSVVGWLLEEAGFDAGRIAPPAGGRAPGWTAGVTLAQRDRPPVGFTSL